MSVSHFDDIATEYDEALPAHVVEHYLRKRTAYVVQNCPRGDGLDVGCGTGVLAERLRSAGYKMWGVDPSEGMIAVARRRAPDVETTVGSGTELPYESSRFDLVITVAVMHHIAAPEAVHRALAEMVRVLKPGGRLVVWDHNPRNPYWSHLMARVPQDTGEERLIPETEIVAGLTGAGARILRSDQLGFVPDFTPSRALRLAAAVERAVEGIPLLQRLCAHNVVLASK
jgi:SAM-dependent methyltransferase